MEPSGEIFMLFHPFPDASKAMWPGPNGIKVRVLETGVFWTPFGAPRHDGVRVRFEGVAEPDSEQVVAPHTLRRI